MNKKLLIFIICSLIFTGLTSYADYSETIVEENFNKQTSAFARSGDPIFYERATDDYCLKFTSKAGFLEKTLETAVSGKYIFKASIKVDDINVARNVFALTDSDGTSLVSGGGGAMSIRTVSSSDTSVYIYGNVGTVKRLKAYTLGSWVDLMMYIDTDLQEIAYFINGDRVLVDALGGEVAPTYERAGFTDIAKVRAVNWSGATVNAETYVDNAYIYGADTDIDYMIIGKEQYTTLISHDFDNQDDGNWNAAGSTSTKTYELYQGSSTDRYLKYSSPSGNYQSFVQKKNINASGNVVMGIDVKAEDANATRNLFVTGGFSNGFARLALADIDLSDEITDNQYCLLDMNSNIILTLDLTKWYKIKVEIDELNQKYNLYVDNELITKDYFDNDFNHNFLRASTSFTDVNIIAWKTSADTQVLPMITNIDNAYVKKANNVFDLSQLKFYENSVKYINEKANLSNGNFIASFTLTNFSAFDFIVQPVLAIYEGSALKEIMPISETIVEKGRMKRVNIPFTISDFSANTKVKVFLFDDLESIKPICVNTTK